MNRDNNIVSTSLVWEGYNIELVIRKSESASLHGMHPCGFQILQVKVDGVPLPINQTPQEVVELLSNQQEETL